MLNSTSDVIAHLKPGGIMQLRPPYLVHLYGRGVLTTFVIKWDAIVKSIACYLA